MGSTLSQFTYPIHTPILHTRDQDQGTRYSQKAKGKDESYETQETDSYSVLFQSDINFKTHDIDDLAIVMLRS